MYKLNYPMKYFSLQLIFSLLFSSLYAQRTIDNPAFSSRNSRILEIEKIVSSDTATVFHFKAYFEPGNWLKINKGSFILVDNSSEKLFVKAATGIQLDDRFVLPATGETTFSLTFPAVGAAAKKVDFIESECDACFKIYDIELTPIKKSSVLPESLLGNWFKVSGEKGWYAGLYDTVAVYKNQVWKYGQPTVKGNKFTINLYNASGQASIQALKDRHNQYRLSSQDIILLGNTPPLSIYGKEVPQTIKNAIINKADSAIYKGYIKGYSTKLGFRTGKVLVNNAASGKQESYTINVAPDGSFSVRFPLSTPEAVIVRFSNIAETVFIEPGKEVFHLMDNNSREAQSLFMGASSYLNYELRNSASVTNPDKHKQKNPSSAAAKGLNSYIERTQK